MIGINSAYLHLIIQSQSIIIPGIPLTVLDEVPVTAMDYLPPSPPTLLPDLPECVTSNTREHSTERKESQKLGTSSMPNPATVVSAVTTQTIKKMSFRGQEDSCARKPSEDVFTSEASVSSATQSEKTGSPPPHFDNQLIPISQRKWTYP